MLKSPVPVSPSGPPPFQPKLVVLLGPEPSHTHPTCPDALTRARSSLPAATILLPHPPRSPPCPREKGTASSALRHKAEQPWLEEQQRGQQMPEAGKGSCLQPHLSIEGRAGAGLFLREEKSYGCEKRRLKIPQGPGSAGGHSEGASQVLVPHVWGKGGNATRVALWPPHGRCTQGAELGCPRPTNRALPRARVLGSASLLVMRTRFEALLHSAGSSHQCWDCAGNGDIDPQGNSVPLSSGKASSVPSLCPRDKHQERFGYEVSVPLTPLTPETFPVGCTH